jgi:hypothetical protein
MLEVELDARRRLSLAKIFKERPIHPRWQVTLLPDGGLLLIPVMSVPVKGDDAST